MSVDTIAIIIASIVLALMGVGIMLGKADWAIKQYRRNSERYNIVRLRVITGTMMIILAIFMPFIPLFEEHESVVAIVVIAVVVLFGMLQETWARRR